MIQSQFTDEDIAFIKEQDHKDKGTPISQTLKSGYIRNLDRPVLQQIENIYKRVINPNFSLCFHCGHEVLNIVRELWEHFEQAIGGVEPVVTEPVVTEPVVTEPVVTEPVVTEPVVTEPVVTEPVVTPTTEGKNKGGRPKKAPVTK